MAIMMRNLYQALREGGASEDAASKAAEEVAGFENRIARIESDLSTLKWMTGANIALTIGVLLKLFGQ